VFYPSDEEQTKKSDIGFIGDIAGKCPLCGADVVRNKFGYGCSSYREGCNFSFGFKICGATISLSQAKKLLENGKTDLIEGFFSKRTGKNFSARLIYSDGKVTFDFS